MKKILFLLLLITSVSYGQAIAPTRVKITNNAISTTAPFVPVQETDGFINKINKSDLIEVIEKDSAVNLPVTGVAGKIYVTLDNNRLYRWTGTIYQDLGYVDISNKVDKVTGKSLISDAEITRLSTLSNFDNSGNVTALNNKVDKVAGKSLISDTEITRLATLANYTHPTNHAPSIITQDANNRFVTDADKSAWNAKQSALGYTAENTANKNNANGYAGLGADGKLISSQLPSITISDTFIAASQAEMLAVTAETGDVVVRTDLNKSFILKGATPTILGNWQELLTPTSAVTTVFGRNGAVTAQSGDYNADQVTETATRKFQTANQNTFNDATSSIQTQINTKQATITAGTTAQYYRGDKTMQTLNSTAVGLGNVNNTTDLLKPISTATQTALNLKANLDSPTFTGAPLAPTATVGTSTTQIANTAFVGSAITTADSGNVKLTGNQTIAGVKTFSNKINVFTGGSGNPAIDITNGSPSSNGISIDFSNPTNGYFLNFANSTVSKFRVSDLGVTTATSFINSTAPATNALLANGTTLANPISGSGTTGYLPKFTSAGVLGNSLVFDNGTKIGVGTVSPLARFAIHKSEVGTNPEAVLRLENTGLNYTSKLVLTDGNTNDANIAYIGTNQSLGFGFGTSLNQMILSLDGSLLTSQYKISALNTAPASATATGTTGEIRITAGFIYICIATNTWVRAALTTWI